MMLDADVMTLSRFIYVQDVIRDNVGIYSTKDLVVQHSSSSTFATSRVLGEAQLPISHFPLCARVAPAPPHALGEAE